jgi:pyruvate dehydrogenase kinase 2/3/4
VATSAIADASHICRRTHGDAPEVLIVGRTDLTFPYVPSHLNYVLVELLKNSMRATVETHGVDKMPPIKIVIADGEANEDVSHSMQRTALPCIERSVALRLQVAIKISDEGGGIKRSNMQRIWSYLYTTADSSALDLLIEQVDAQRAAALQAASAVSQASTAEVSTRPANALRDFSTASPLAGLGYGLPIARNYARYFGGELKIMSMEGYGTDGYIYLPRLGNTDASV